MYSEAFRAIGIEGSIRCRKLIVPKKLVRISEDTVVYRLNLERVLHFFRLTWGKLLRIRQSNLQTFTAITILLLLLFCRLVYFMQTNDMIRPTGV